MPGLIPYTWFEALPKVELHLHLEGAIPLETLWTLTQKYGGDEDVPDLESLSRLFTFRDFPHFLELWRWKDRFLREYDDFTFAAEAVARHLAGQNIRYVEAFFSAPGYPDLDPQRLFQAVRQGLDRVPEVEVTLVADLVRDLGSELGMTTLEQVAELRDLGVIGIGIGGAEHDHPPEPFAPVYERARHLGLHTTAHAGEAAGTDSIWGAIKSLHVERIGHGTRAEEDPTLVDYLAQARIPIEMCPISNVRTGVVDSYQEHPVRRYVEQGLLVTVNTDDPAMFGNSLADEYAALHQSHGLGAGEIRALILNGAYASWLDPQRQQDLARALQADPAWNAQ